MNRRDSLKYLATGTLASGLLWSACDWGTQEKAVMQSLWKYQYGRTPEEMAHDNKLLGQQFFSEAELQLLTDLAHLILPPNENGDIEKAGVPAFIEFMVKDYENFQIPLRTGLAELNARAMTAHGQAFQALEIEQQQLLLDPIAYPDEVENALQEQARFFTLLRNLVVTGYFTSAVGIQDLGYQGNQPNIWDGVPDTVLQAHNLSYDPDWETKFLDTTRRNEKAKWDEEGRLLT